VIDLIAGPFEGCRHGERCRGSRGKPGNRVGPRRPHPGAACRDVPRRL